MRTVLLVLVLVCLSIALPSASGASGTNRLQRSQPSGVEDRGIIALDQVLRELTNPYSVMCVAAGYDDVDWGALAYYHKKLGARAIVVLASRSGAGLEGAGEPGEDRAIVATRRALAAAQIVGADVHFLDLRDSGDSKSADDLLKQWGLDQAISQLVRAFRLLRPDVVITNHGLSFQQPRHEAVWRLVIEAFEAAADAKRFSEADSRVWQVRRVFQTADEASADVGVNLAEYDHARGIRYAQIAAEALPSRRPASEPSRSLYKLARSVTGESLTPGGSLLTGLALPENVGRSIAAPGIAGAPLLNAINQRDQLVETLVDKLLEKRVEGSVDELYQRYGVEFSRVLRFRDLLERAIALVLGLDFRIAFSDDLVVPGQKVTAHLVLNNGSNGTLPVVFRTPPSLAHSKANSPQTASETVAVPATGTASSDFEYEISPNASSTLPHSAHLSERNYYPLGSGLPGAQSTNPFGNEVFAYAEVGIGQTFIILPAMVRYDVAAPVEISVTPSFALIRDWTEPRETTFVARVRNRTPGALAGALWVVPLAITAESYEPAHITFAREDEEVEIRLRLKVPILKPPLAPDILINSGERKPAPPTPLASMKITVMEAGFEVTPGTTVGFIRGSNSEMLIALSQLGVDTREISLDEVRVQDAATPQGLPYPGCSELSRSTRLSSTFAYSVRRDLATANRCLLDYVRKGGNLVVLGQMADEWNAQSVLGLAPFPIKLSTSDSPQSMKVLSGDHVLMSQPNKMDEKDFDNWIVEGSAAEWAPEYTSLLGPAGSRERSALLVARLGEGNYVYASFDLRDQLRARNPRAYKFLANLVSPRGPGCGPDDWQ